MTQVQVRAYTSPTLVLLAVDWPDGALMNDFLGFAIRRLPGFGGADASWLPNRIGFSGPVTTGNPDLDSDAAPIQKFMWWDARIDAGSAGKTFTYAVIPVRGSPAHPTLLGEAAGEIDVTIPANIENGIGTWFNRAVVSSQAFSRLAASLGVSSDHPPTPEVTRQLRTWLANGMETVIPLFLKEAHDHGQQVSGAIYHLTDDLWVIPAIADFAGQDAIEMVYDNKIPEANQKALDALGDLDNVTFHPRDKTNIMHNKFLVRGKKLSTNSPQPAAVLCGSANFTTEGLTSQANLLHTFDSSELAQEYLEREKRISSNPTLAKTAEGADWSYMHTIGGAGVRVFFSPEPTSKRDSIDTIVRAIHQAQSSVLFCLFTPTDAPLRDACFAAGDNGKMMFGLVNNIADKEGQEVDEEMRADTAAAIELYHRSKNQRDVIGAAYYHWDNTPTGFENEWQLFPGQGRPPYPPVIIHHKFIIIDAETSNPVIFSGSANMSKNSVNKNDENLLEIRGSRRLASIYLAEFMRLYEHYRARASWVRFNQGSHTTYQLARDASWCRKHYTPGTPEAKARIAMAKL